mgnify:CR=1 FL=1
MCEPTNEMTLSPLPGYVINNCITHTVATFVSFVWTPREVRRCEEQHEISTREENRRVAYVASALDVGRVLDHQRAAILSRQGLEHV